MNTGFNKKESINSYLNKETEKLHSINDLREKELSGEQLSADEKKALANFDKYKISELNKQTDDTSFHKRYRELQVIANLGNYEEFLKEKYN